MQNLLNSMTPQMGNFKDNLIDGTQWSMYLTPTVTSNAIFN